MKMWRSAVGVRATPEAMLETLRTMPMARDIVDRINEHCEWINLTFQALAFLHRHPRKRVGFCKEAEPGKAS